MAGGRRPQFEDPEVKERLLSAIRDGNYLHVAASYAGIGKTTLMTWMQRGREEQTGPYRELWDEITRASREAEVQAVAAIRKAFGEDWRSAVEYLKRRHPKRWNRAYQAMEHSGPDGGPMEFRELTDDELVDRAQQLTNRVALLAKRGNGNGDKRKRS